MKKIIIEGKCPIGYRKEADEKVTYCKGNSKIELDGKVHPIEVIKATRKIQRRISGHLFARHTIREVVRVLTEKSVTKRLEGKEMVNK